MIYLYRRTPSNSARDLADAMTLNARKINDLRSPHFNSGLRSGDHLICWGERVAPIDGVQILNGTPLATKYEDALKLKAENVPTVEVALQPQAVNNVSPRQARLVASGVALHQLLAITPIPADRFEALLGQFNTDAEQLRAALRNPSPVREWLPRRNNHIGGSDLLRPPASPDFYSVKLDLVEEYRVHLFRGKSIRAGKKAPRAGVEQHPWVRSFDGGWAINYDGFSSTKAMRKISIDAIKALGLDFGAVDIGKTRDNRLVVLEVNRAPGLEGNSLSAYAGAIKNWVEGSDGAEV